VHEEAEDIEVVAVELLEEFIFTHAGSLTFKVLFVLAGGYGAPFP
jgi:hypothetical protein